MRPGLDLSNMLRVGMGLAQGLKYVRITLYAPLEY